MRYCYCLCAVTLAAVAGCRPQLAFPELHPLAGTISRDGQPMKGGGLIFLRDAGDPTGMIVNANVNADGTFFGESSLTSVRGADIRPGVPVGRYRAIYHPLSDGAVTGLDTKIEGIFEFVAGPNRIDIVLKGATSKGAGEVRDDANPPAPSP